MTRQLGQEGKDEREKVRMELARANELLTGIKTEMRVLEARRDEIRQGIEAETARLKREREDELADVVAQAEAAIAPLKAERAQLNDAIAQLTRDKIKVESEHEGLVGQIASERTTLGQITREVSEAQARRDKVDAQAVAVSAKITSLTSNVQPLREEIATLTGEVRAATAKRDETTKEIVTLQNNHASRRKDLELEIASLERRRNELATTLTAEAQGLAKDREELTLWAEKLSKQDKVIRAREYKVALAEQKIADNVNLLNL